MLFEYITTYYQNIIMDHSSSPRRCAARVRIAFLLLAVAIFAPALLRAQSANYARAPRFNALICYDPSAEPDHVACDKQALDFFWRLSFGEGFTYDVVSSLDSIPGAGYKDYDVVVMLNTEPQTRAQRRASNYE